MVQGDGEGILVDSPELLENRLGLRARIDEHQAHPRRADTLVNFVNRVRAAVSRPRQPLARIQHGEFGWCAGRRANQSRFVNLAAPLANKPALQFCWIANRCRESDSGRIGRNGSQPRQIESQQVAALGCHHRMQFIQHDALQRCKQGERIG